MIIYLFSSVEAFAIIALQFLLSCFVVIIFLIFQIIFLVEVFSNCVICFVGYFLL
jgi:hypothetical protein